MYLRVEKLKKIIHRFHLALTTPLGVFLSAAILGVLFFVCFYGTRVLDPTYIDWLLGGEDLKQHFIGWEFYRTEAWSIPLGAIHQLAYPFGISVTFMDSIPLMAIPFKVVSGILPEQFQYFGIWGLLCYGLQGGLAGLIIRRYSKNLLVVLLGAVIFIVSPMMIARMFSHTALAGHWIVLLSILLLLERRRITKLWQFIAVWSGIFMLAGATHPYFLPMVALPFAITVILTHKTWIASFAKAMIPPLVGLIFFWAIGGLAVMGGDPGGLGEYALNLSSLYNSLGYSAFFDPMPISSSSGETLNYLGLGTMLLAAVAFVAFVYNYRSLDRLRAMFRRLKWRHLLVALCVVGLTVVAISPRVQWGVKLLADIDLPSKVEKAWATFRASGRLFWVLYYMITVAIIAYVVTALRGRKWQTILIAIMAIVAVVQTVDIVGSMASREKYTRFVKVNQGVSYDFSKVDQWNAHAAGKKHMIYLGSLSGEDFFELSDVALKYGLTMNDGYFARSPKEKIARHEREQTSLLLAGTADIAQNLYITKDKALLEQMTKAGRTVTTIGGYSIIN